MTAARNPPRIVQVQGKHEARNAVRSSPERDASVERLLRRTLRASEDTPPTGACVDPETLAAWADGNLPGESLELAQAHVAECSRCQTVLGTLTRVRAALPEPGKPKDQTSPNWLGWLVPLSAAAVGVIAVALWVSLPRSVAPVQQQPNEEIAEAGKQAAVQQAPEQSARVAAPAAVGAVVDGIKPAERQSPPDRTREAEVKRDSQAAVPADAAAAATSPAAVTSAAGSRQELLSAVTEIVSPDPAVRWRITGGAVQRSANGGSSWANVSVGFQGQITAGSAPLASVCWLVGRGMVLLSTDGGTSWRRVAFPEPTDLSAVRATDARTAFVTTADGRTFSTNDGGLTWAREAPQDF